MTEAETVLRRAIAINDKHFYANYDLGRLLVKSRKYDQALPILEHAAALKPNNPAVHYQLFMALSRLKRKDDADRELATFKELDEARKARPRSETEIDDEDLQNPAPSPSSDRPTPIRSQYHSRRGLSLRVSREQVPPATEMSEKSKIPPTGVGG